MKQKIYPTMIGIVGIGLIVVVLGRLGAMNWENLRSPEPPLLDSPPSSPAPEATASPPAIAPPSPRPSPLVSPTMETSSPTPVPAVTPAPTAIEGRFRVSNQTDHPIRVALLSSLNPPGPGEAQGDAAPPSDSASYQEPVHWDFAPQEGNAKGLILSLPDAGLQLQAGDIVVAFAQDGSRRYWGPFVVGKTALPTWDADANEWQLILSP